MFKLFGRRIKLKFVFAIFRSIAIKARYGRRISFDVSRTFFGPGFRLEIVGAGRLRIEGKRDRVYFDRGVTVVCSQGLIEVGSGTFFNAYCRLTSHTRISIGRNCLFGPNVSVYDSDHRVVPGVLIREVGYEKSAVEISDNCWIGTNVVILRGSSIGAGTVVGANSVVRGPLEGNRVYAGAPARLIREIT